MYKRQEQTAYEIDKAVREIVDEAFQQALSVLKSKRNLLEEASQVLLEQETLEREEIDRMIEVFDDQKIKGQSLQH